MKVTGKWSAAEVIGTAKDLVSGDRAAQHGDKLVNHQHVAALWTAYLGVTITADQVALMMVLLKVARTKAGTVNRDDFVDMAGYAGEAGRSAGTAMPVPPDEPEPPARVGDEEYNAYIQELETCTGVKLS